MKILFAANEVTGIYKLGGLGDVAAALPKAVATAGHDIRIIMPKHPEIDVSNNQWTQQDSFDIEYGQETLTVKVWIGALPDSFVPVIALEEETYLSQHTDASDNHADKYAVFSLAIAAFVAEHSSYWQPHVLHINDWHTSLVPFILKHRFNHHLKSLITIHNLAFQGDTDTPVADKLHIPEEACQILQYDKTDSYINILMEGILHVDAIVTVSPQYREEILTETYGESLSHILEAREEQLFAILNGLDVEEFNPATDRFVEQTYTIETVMEKKKQNRQLLQQELGLDTSVESLIGFVGRVDPVQKGIDLIIEAIRQDLLPLPNTQFVFLGTGDPHLEQQLHAAASGKDNLHIATRFDEALARKMYAAATYMLIPSKFEPCGLVQLIAMRYGSLPVARSVGGLKDTIDHNQTGYLFEEYTTSAMMECLKQATDDPQTISSMVQQAMKQDFSWKRSAQEYVNLYKQLVEW